MPSSVAKVALVELFRSIQGEGFNSGRLAIFVRISGCNLSCVFAEGAVCDTPYQQAKLKLTVNEIMDTAVQLLEPAASTTAVHDHEARPMLILTGGEPTRAPAFDTLVYAGLDRGFYVAVETNGTTWRKGLKWCHWVTVSPKADIGQGSPAKFHNPHPQDPAVSVAVASLLAFDVTRPSGEYRYVVGSADAPAPPYAAAFRHYVSPAILSDGSGLEWQAGFPGFVPGALERCLAIVEEDPRWRISLQQHKVMGLR